jgi:hypothetical protein
MYTLLIHERKLKSIALFITFLLIPLRQKLQLRQRLKLFKRTQKEFNIISNLFLDFFIRLTWHHSSYNHIPIHYNHEIINVVKIQIVLWSFFSIRLSFWVPWLWICHDFKNILSNLQYKDHKITTINDTSWLPKFPHIKPLKWLEMAVILKKLRESKKSH